MFAIYFPGATGSNLDHFHRAGLSDLLGADADAAPSFTDFDFGPDGAHGVAASWAGRPILPGEFEWTKCRKGSFWLGKLGGEKPKPEWFERKTLHDGEKLTLGDGQEWVVPVARQLPHLIGLDDNGQVTRTLLPQYKRFWEAAEKTLGWFEEDERGGWSVPLREILEFTALALSINYRVNPDVCSWLGLVRDDLAWRMAGIVTDWEGLRRARKKKESAGSLTSAGVEG